MFADKAMHPFQIGENQVSPKTLVHGELLKKSHQTLWGVLQESTGIPQTFNGNKLLPWESFGDGKGFGIGKGFAYLRHRDTPSGGTDNVHVLVAQHVSP